MANRNLTSALVSALIGSLSAFAACLVFFYFFYEPAQPVDAKPPQPPAATPIREMPNPEINAADVTSVSINTIYRGYFDAGDKCAKSYNEYFGNSDGFGSPSSPCTIKITFGRDGHATRSIEIGRWDKTTKEKKMVEKTESSAEITPEQFTDLANTIVGNDAFKSWREGTMITVSNCSITVNHAGGIKTVMSNVDEKTTTYLQMVDALKRLEKQLRWK